MKFIATESLCSLLLLLPAAFIFQNVVFSCASSSDDQQALLDSKPSLDPQNIHLASWTAANGGESGGGYCETFEGVECQEKDRVSKISLPGLGLTGKLPPAFGQLKQLTGLYLQNNSLTGELPKEIFELGLLSNLNLNGNNFSGEIPTEIGNMANLQVLQLGHNQFSGSIPTRFGEKLSVLALPSNRLTGAIPASLGNLSVLMTLDLSFNRLFGSIPFKLADAPMLRVLDVRNNTLSGNLPSGLRKLEGGFRYADNLGLCGIGYEKLEACRTVDGIGTERPGPFGANGPGPREIVPATLKKSTRPPREKGGAPADYQPGLRGSGLGGRPALGRGGGGG